jgi:hypothetical protein
MVSGPPAGAAAGAWGRVKRIRLFVALLVLLVTVARGDDEVYDDDLSQTNADAERYSAGTCAKYLCPSYASETKKYLQEGCEHDFGSYLPADGASSGEVSVSAALVVAGCSFLGAFIIGVFLGKSHKSRE